MERLAWVEILDRHGDVTSRQPVYAWPLSVGRAYTNDIVLDDPYVAASHLEINQAGAGHYQMKIVSSINAMMLDTMRGKQAEANVPTNHIVRIGHTQLRIRPVNFEVSEERPLPNNAWSRSLTAFFSGIVLLLLMHLLTLWLNYDRAEGYSILLLPVLGGIILLSLWVGFWALIGRVLSGRANFVAHAVNACLTVALLIFLDGLLYGYVDFSLNTNLISDLFPEVVEPLVIGTLLYRHIGLVSRMSRRKVGIIVATMMASLIGFGYVTEKYTADNKVTDMSYSRTIGPPFMMLIHGIPSGAFIDGASGLKLKVDNQNKT